MLKDFFLEQVRKNFPFQPTPEQGQALEMLGHFLLDRNNDSLFLLKGYAGTGKSSLIGAMVKTLNELQQKVVLLAPTGRAAKVFASYAGQNALTIHKKIYRQKAFSNDPSGFVLADNLHKHTLFIVDEASMISNDGLDSFTFGSGRLLDDLIHFVYGGEGCRMILLGDSAQLPPVMQTESPALNPDILKGYGLDVSDFTLTHVVRQAEASGILMNATSLRKSLENGETDVFPKLRTENYPDIEIVNGDTLIDKINEAYDRDGQEETIIICRSNKRANIFNNGIRNRILFCEEELESGDWLMIAKNNYYWGKDEKTMDFIANGDLIEVKRIRKIQEMYGFRFCDIVAHFPDYELDIELKILLESLHTDTPSIPKEMSEKLFLSLLEDYSEIPGKREKMKKLKEDTYYNVVLVKYAYAVTCHKAQGGQWKNVFLDLSYVPAEYLNVEFYRWLYTAFTRATQKIYLINPVKDLLETLSASS